MIFTVRPLGRKDYQLIIIAKGGAVFLHNRKEIILSGGEMILILVREFQLHRVGFMNNCNGYLLNILTLVKRRIDAARFLFDCSQYPITGKIHNHRQTDFGLRRPE